MYTIYAKTNNAGCIIAIQSTAFLHDASGWTKIDEGEGYKFEHAQNHYLEKPIIDDDGVFRYKLMDGEPVERTQAEMDADRAQEDDPSPALESRVETLERENAELKEALELLLSGEVE